MTEKVIIMGAAGRDFHNFNVYFKDNRRYNVIAFTAAQIPLALRDDCIRRNCRDPCIHRAYPIYPEEETSPN